MQNINLYGKNIYFDLIFDIISHNFIFHIFSHRAGLNIHKRLHLASY